MPRFSFNRLLLCYICTLSYVFSQTQKGNITTGASADVASTFVAATKYNNSYFLLSVNPGLTYFVINDLGVGGTLNFTMRIDRREQITSFISEVGPMLRYYFSKNRKSNKKGFAQLHGGYVTSTFLRKGETSGREGWFIGAMLGFAYFINTNISLETSLGYNFNKQKDWETTHIPLKVGFNIFLSTQKAKSNPFQTD
ncbi:MAG: hypothetical protein RMJ53_10095 [Chitinophagales bacterium]|nr:hypothetical protein [Chitinophagales bacterium]MDW8274567.1 hypothetical protein [Chitinophagales bacterium]